jgi:hypothetical protein
MESTALINTIFDKKNSGKTTISNRSPMYTTRPVGAAHTYSR